VALEWTITLFFGQDDVQLGVLATGQKVERAPDPAS